MFEVDIRAAHAHHELQDLEELFVSQEDLWHFFGDEADGPDGGQLDEFDGVVQQGHQLYQGGVDQHLGALGGQA